jgi:ATP-binding cassette subfamily C exporter for protease/lipase
MLEGVHKRWMTIHRKTLKLQATASDHAGLTGAIAKSVQILQGSALLGLGCWFYLSGHFPDGGGMMIVVSILGGKVLQPLVKVVTQWRMVINARDARQRLEQFLHQFAGKPAQMPLPAPKGDLSVEGVTVHAPGTPQSQPVLLRNIEFKLPAGTVLAVIGPSGSGKTTLAKALLGLLPATAGKVRLDGIDVFARDKEQLGPHLGYLPQEVALFDGTLAQNVARLGPIDDLRLRQACQVAGLNDLVAQLPLGYDTPIGPSGAFLSGGQRQRVGLARVLYGEPIFVVLDEPYSNLDEQGEAVLLQAVRTLKQRKCTVVLITHLSSMLVVADSILVLANASVQAIGPRDEILAALAKAQAAQSAASAPARTTAQDAA